MTVRTLGEAFDLGWQALARCGGWQRIGSQPFECGNRYRLDMETLVWTRGRTLLLDCVHKRLKCPKCGDRLVTVLFEPPANPAKRAARVG
jgi:hypothetical protein